ncbi:26S proteasome non-ATPase regulatory subunit 2-like isoform X2 [Sinocyclocheilus anshuiensis]|uniref:26S proteasome non-ATPase regulatory subunit 2-like isoform X2 n=1 Tax=Sinocyclocheilus anshuiensis TaxID=1608454 RepID=UPI0007B96FB3|nr:PREDICTED: 26S proteasome non-ATPase regulatory subunit 2-like isoform X2 [Sinocyclocheilus anshuiensis]
MKHVVTAMVWNFAMNDRCVFCVSQEKDTSLYRPALEELRRQIRSSTTSMTSVPKPLKFLRPHYAKLKEIYQNMTSGDNKFCADVVSVLAMTMSSERECLKYRLLGSQEELASWGHEYVRYDMLETLTLH